ncbi:NUDIX domain-containing protein [Burkholderia pseudomallei]|uniref:NUDIX domain-containing protein n=1 Tax=Burkholderia pseudomallei TaxID=28450 RepID=UPI003995C6A2
MGGCTPVYETTPRQWSPRPPSLGRLSPRRPPSTPPRPSRNERRSCAAAAPACRSSPARCRAGRPPGGIIRCGEAPLDAARRALEEQTRLAGLELMYFFHVDGHAKRPPCSSPACRPACARARAARSPAAAGRLPTRSRACLCVPVTTPTRATVARLASAEGAPPARGGRRAASHVLVADVAAHLAAEHPI